MNEQVSERESRQTHCSLYMALLIVCLLHLPLSVFPVGRDQGVWATAGMAINRGSIFFKDYLHFNLPGLAFSYALAYKLFDDPRTATMVLSLAGSIMIIIGMYILMQKAVGNVAASWSVLLFAVLWPMRMNFWTIAQKDFMAMFGVMLGTGLFAQAESESRWRNAFIYLSGIFAGLSAMYKPLFAFAGLLMALILAGKFFLPPDSIFNKTKNQWAIFLRELTLFACGVLTIALTFIVYLVKGNAFQNFYHGIFIVAPMYSSISNRTFLEMLINIALRSSIIPIQLGWLPYLIVWTPIMIKGAIILAKRAKVNTCAWLGIPFLTAIFTYFVQKKAISYHSCPWQICEFMIAGCFFEWCFAYAKTSSL